MSADPPSPSLLAVVAGLALVGYAVHMTHATYHPLPPGGDHVDGRGLLAPFVIVPLATVGGLLVAAGTLHGYVPADGWFAESVLYLAAVWIAVSGPVAYVTLFTGPDVVSELSPYAIWYGVSFATTAVLVGGGKLLAAIWRPATTGQ